MHSCCWGFASCVFVTLKETAAFDEKHYQAQSRPSYRAGFVRSQLAQPCHGATVTQVRMACDVLRPPKEDSTRSQRAAQTLAHAEGHWFTVWCPISKADRTGVSVCMPVWGLPCVCTCVYSCGVCMCVYVGGFHMCLHVCIAVVCGSVHLWGLLHVFASVCA